MFICVKMLTNSENCRSNCPINFALELFGDKWTLLIIRDLMFKEKSYYGDFLSSQEGVSTNILADRLKRLEMSGVICKLEDPENRKKQIYSLTTKGKDLLPVMLEITAWSAQYDAHTNTPRNFVAALTEDKQAVIHAMRENLGK
tara:strand:+ start:1487 stop:1918 length:432 start_codon:yes stop_codon:yes gene_type:complete